MARYRACIHPDYKNVNISRLGHRRMSADINGWNIGVTVELSRDPDNENLDSIKVMLTGGSNNTLDQKLLIELSSKHIKSEVFDIGV